LFAEGGDHVRENEAAAAITHTWSYPQNVASGTQETLLYDGTPLTSLAITRNGREMETSRKVTIGSGVTATLTTADTAAGRDTADRWTQRTIQRSGYAAKTQSRAFDAAGRLTTQSGLGFSSAGSYTYDANSGRKTAESLPFSLGGTLTGSYTYYPGGSLATATTNGSSESFTYDEVGNLVSDTVSDVQATAYSYDDPATQDDDGENRLYSTTTTEATDGASPVTTYYGCDEANAWRTCQGEKADPTPANSPIDYSYNALGRMSAYANSDANTSAAYTYDAAGQRVKKEVTVAGMTTTTTYGYDGLTLLRLSAVQGATSWRIDYLYDEEGALWGGVYRSPAGSTSPVYFTMITSDRGDVVELCDAAGNPFAAYRYDAWGLPQGEGSYATGIWTQSTSLITSTLAGQIATRQVLRYASYAWDAESSLYYCSARYYDPATRQWTTGDPAKADGEESAYQYCAGDPVGSVDPTGEAVNKWDIVRYAKKYWYNYNPKYLNFEEHGSRGGDCTNFVSQCLRAGGWEMKGRWSHKSTRNWFYRFHGLHVSWTWVGPKYWPRFGLYSKRIWGRSKPKNLQFGDILTLDQNNQGVWSHAMVCIGRYRGIPKLVYHTWPTKTTLRGLKKKLGDADYRLKAWGVYGTSGGGGGGGGAG